MTKLERPPDLNGVQEGPHTSYDRPGKTERPRRNRNVAFGSGAIGLVLLGGALFAHNALGSNNTPEEHATSPETTTSQEHETEPSAEASPDLLEITDGYYLYNPVETEISLEGSHEAQVEQVSLTGAELYSIADAAEIPLTAAISPALAGGLSEWMMTSVSVDKCREYIESDLHIQEFARNEARRVRMIYQEAWFGDTTDPDDDTSPSLNDAFLQRIEDQHAALLAQALPNMINSERDTPYTMRWELVEQASEESQSNSNDIENGHLVLRAVIEGTPNTNLPEPESELAFEFDAWFQDPAGDPDYSPTDESRLQLKQVMLEA